MSLNPYMDFGHWCCAWPNIKTMLPFPIDVVNMFFVNLLLHKLVFFCSSLLTKKRTVPQSVGILYPSPHTLFIFSIAYVESALTDPLIPCSTFIPRPYEIQIV